MTDTRNVADRFKNWETELIRKALDADRLPFITALENISGDFNKATAIRSHNVFLGREVWIIGKKGWDTRGAVGAQHYEWIYHFPTWHDAFDHYFDNIYDPHDPMSYYEFVGVEQAERSKPISSFRWAKNTVMIFGEEARGISEQGLTACNDVVYIPQRGSIRSLNVASAAAIAMYDYCVKTGSM